jgi:hypothetical protein
MIVSFYICFESVLNHKLSIVEPQNGNNLSTFKSQVLSLVERIGLEFGKRSDWLT